MTKEQLRRYQAIKNEKIQIEQRLRKLEKQPDSELEPLRKLYRKKFDELVALQVSIEQAIDSLEPVERELFRYRYIDGLEWHQVAAKIHYSWQSTHRIHAEALIKLADK